MKPSLIITSPDLPDLSLESVNASHLESLRLWKNAFRHRFFFQEDITPERQATWYAGYLARPDDWIFMIRECGSIVGCVGYRLVDHIADIYNVLREPGLARRSNAHVHAVDLLCNHIAAAHTVPIRGEVLADNPMNRWAAKRGFNRIGQSVRHGLAYNVLQQDAARRIRYTVEVAVGIRSAAGCADALTAER